MALSMEDLIKRLPVDVKKVTAQLAKEDDLKGLLFVTEQIELQAPISKIDTNVLVVAYLYELLLNMILNELCQAKYLWKRFPKELKADTSANAIWKIGQSMWKSEYSLAFELIDNALSSDMNDLFKPFLSKLKTEYRRRCIDLVCLSYSSITIKELLGYISNKKDKTIIGKDNGITFIKSIIKSYNLNDKFTLDENTGIIQINNSREEYDLDVNLMNEFTRYVCFMESHQTV